MRAARYRNGFSRSANAEDAESEGRFPRLRAAKHLGLSARAFDAGCKEAAYVAREWHHVGRFANKVDYYDCEELAANAAFWRGAAGAYRSKAKQRDLLVRAEKAAAEEAALAQQYIERRRAWFAARLARQRDCTRGVHRRRDNIPYRRSSRDNWREFVRAKFRAHDRQVNDALDRVAPGDFDGLTRAIEAAPIGYGGRRRPEAGGGPQ